MDLSVRLQMNADMVPRGCRLADIGCDHGYVSIYLAENNLCDKILAMDVGEGPLAAARKNVKDAGLSDRVECRLSDGLKGMEAGEADTLLIAGMGGMLACRILEQGYDVLDGIKTLILQPQSDFREVREKIALLGFVIEEECCCNDGGKWYLAMRASRGEQPQVIRTEEEYRYGWILQRKNDVVYYSYLMREREKMQQVMKALEKARSTARSEARIHELQESLDLLETSLSRFSMNE